MRKLRRACHDHNRIAALHGSANVDDVEIVPLACNASPK